jgi:hypothetical protein
MCILHAVVKDCDESIEEHTLLLQVCMYICIYIYVLYVCVYIYIHAQHTHIYIYRVCVYCMLWSKTVMSR